MSGAAAVIDIVAAVIEDTYGRVLVVRKHGASAFMQPGGKPEQGETPLQSLARELAEELSVRLLPGTARPLGRFEDWALNEPGMRVRADVFQVQIEGTPRACAEIAELAWLAPCPPHALPLAPLSAQQILPALMQRRAAG